MKLLKNTRPEDGLPTLRKLAAFLLSGVVNTSIGIGVFAVAYFGMALSLVVSNALSYSVGLLTALLLSRTWVFPSRRNFFLYSLRFLVIFCIAYLINRLVLSACVHYAPGQPVLAQFLAMVSYTATFFPFALKFLGPNKE